MMVDAAAVAEGFFERIVGDAVEFLDGFALDVFVAGGAPDVDQSGAVDVRRDDLGRQRDGGDQPDELAVGRGVVLEVAHDVLFDGDELRLGALGRVSGDGSDSSGGVGHGGTS